MKIVELKTVKEFQAVLPAYPSLQQFTPTAEQAIAYFKKLGLPTGETNTLYLFKGDYYYPKK